MRDLLDELDAWKARGKKIAIARVVDIEGSGPRDPGAAMAVNEDGDVIGSVSGGCVEGAVVAEALAMLKDGIERQYVAADADEPVVDVTIVGRRRARYAEAIGNARNWDDRIGEPDDMDQALAELLAGAV